MAYTSTAIKLNPNDLKISKNIRIRQNFRPRVPYFVYQICKIYNFPFQFVGICCKKIPYILAFFESCGYQYLGNDAVVDKTAEI